jgi:hypothetical protein
MSETDNVLRPEFLTKLPLDPERILSGAAGKLSEVVVLGWEKAEDGNGAFYFAASDADLSRASMLLLRATKQVTDSME